MKKAPDAGHRNDIHEPRSGGLNLCRPFKAGMAFSKGIASRQWRVNHLLVLDKFDVFQPSLPRRLL